MPREIATRAMVRVWILSLDRIGVPAEPSRDSRTRRQNAVLMAFAAEELKRGGAGRLLDIGCGAGRNALPLARLGWDVVGIDLSWPMLSAAANRAHEHRLDDRIHLALAPMDRIPARDRSFDLVIAHGILESCAFRRAIPTGAR